MINDIRIMEYKIMAQVQDKQTVKKEITETGKSKGILSNQEILDTLGDIDFELYELEELYNNLKSAGVEIIEDDILFDDFANLINNELKSEFETDEIKERHEAGKSIFDDDRAKIYLEEIADFPLLTSEEEIDLVIKIGEGDNDAKQRLCEANLRLVVNVVKRYLGRGIPLIDLIADGNHALICATEKFDLSKGVRFSTYVSWCVRQEIIRHIVELSRPHSIPVHLLETINKVKETKKQLLHQNGYEPTATEIAEKTGVPEDKVSEIIKII